MLRRFTPILLVALALPAFAGCLGDDSPDSNDDGVVAASATDAGAVNGPAPAAPQDPYRVNASPAGTGSSQTASTITVHPARFATNPAREPDEITIDGSFTPADCNPAGNVPLAGSSFQLHDLSESIQPGDVYAWHASMTIDNSDASWGDMHLFYGFGVNTGGYNEFTGDKRGPFTMEFHGQAYRLNADDPVWVGAGCWFGFSGEQLHYQITIHVTYAEAAVPASLPVLLAVPDEATTLYARGVALDPNAPVTSHFRIFGPDDALLCECALLSNQEVSTFTLPSGGDYVILVDHTENGFLSLGLDAPPAADLRPLSAAPTYYPVYSSDGENDLDTTVEVIFPSQPLNINSWVYAKDWQNTDHDIGSGKNFRLTLSNSRGDVHHTYMAGYYTHRFNTPVMSSQDWFAMPVSVDGEWDFYTEHHAFAPGPHLVEIKADAFRGEVGVWALQYQR